MDTAHWYPCSNTSCQSFGNVISLGSHSKGCQHWRRHDDAPPHYALCIVDHCSKREDSDGTCADSDEDHEDLAGRREDLAGRCMDSDEEHEELNDKHQGSDD